MNLDLIEETLPDSWGLRTVDELASVVMVGIASAATHAYRSSGIPMVRNTNIKVGYIETDDLLFIDPEYEKAHKNKRLRAGDVITVRTGNPGISAVVPPVLAGAQCFTSLITRPRKELVLANYLCSFINSPLGERQFTFGQAGGAQQNVNAGTLSKMLVPLPPLAEQTEIIAVLECWEERIGAVARRLEQGQTRRQALLQQLLTGKRRFPGCQRSAGVQSTAHGPVPADWTYCRIGEIADEYSARNNDGKVRPVLSCTKSRGLVDSLEYFGKQIFSEDLSTYRVVRRGHFAYATNHIDEGSIGLQNLHDEAVISPMYTVFAPRRQSDAKFLFLLFKTEWYRQIFASNTSASVDRRGGLRWDDFARIHVALPSPAEQAAIVTAIETADREIHLLQNLQTAYRQQKRGLMQQLLTGRRRVPVPTTPDEAAP